MKGAFGLLPDTPRAKKHPEGCFFRPHIYASEEPLPVAFMITRLPAMGMMVRDWIIFGIRSRIVMNMFIFMVIHIRHMLWVNMRNDCFRKRMILTVLGRMDNRPSYIWSAMVHEHSPFLSFNTFTLLNYVE